ncbi:hypothetical protein L914_19260 [Phytophthora nicotianae]|uniref:Uncharacterized protein n=1 Tax=Phytophthora nicotianae TaxID=4792 RepID=W2MB36_PHYNI|nr:hypothetical protein L914_19260 [Phytophthora nicotianae]
MAHDRSTHDEIPVSPKKKLKITIEKHKRKVFDTVDDLREFIMHIDDNDKDVCALARIKARLLWIASDTVRGLHFLRLYFGEWQAPEPFKEQQQVITPFKHLAAVNQFVSHLLISFCRFINSCFSINPFITIFVLIHNIKNLRCLRTTRLRRQPVRQFTKTAKLSKIFVFSLQHNHVQSAIDFVRER